VVTALSYAKGSYKNFSLQNLFDVLINDIFVIFVIVAKEGDENCLICGRPKSKHSPEELLTCSRKMEEFKKNTTGGAGIE